MKILKAIIVEDSIDWDEQDYDNAILSDAIEELEDDTWVATKESIEKVYKEIKEGYSDDELTITKLRKSIYKIMSKKVYNKLITGKIDKVIIIS